MEPHEIEIGKVYSMDYGWYRKPVRLWEDAGVGYVEYLVGRSPYNLTGVSRGPQKWFSLNVRKD